MRCRLATVPALAAVVVGLGLAPSFAGTDPLGFIDEVLFLGPYTGPGCGPDAGQRAQDYLCDEIVSESDIIPEAGLLVSPPVTDASDCQGNQEPALQAFHPNALVDPLTGQLAIQVLPSTGSGGVIDFDAATGAGDNMLNYGWFYVTNDTASDLMLELGIASDDSYEVRIDRKVVASLNVCRGFGGAGAIQERYPVRLTPGGHLVQVKVWDGCCPTGFRLRFEDPATCLPILSDEGQLTVGIDPVPISKPDFLAVRTISATGEAPAPVTANVTVAVTSDGSYSLEERFDSGWTASAVSPAPAVNEAGRLAWNNISAASVSYTLSRTGNWFFNEGLITGTVSNAIETLPVEGDSRIPGGGAPFVREWLVIPGLLIGTGSNGCTIPAVEITGPWVTDGGDLTDQNFIPEEGLVFVVDHFGASQSGGFAVGINEADYINDPGIGTEGIVNVEVADGNGLLDFQRGDIFGQDIDIVAGFGYFYVENTTASPQERILAVGGDDSAGVWLNGFPVWANTVCRGHPGFGDKFKITLDPGKNLITVAAFENGGGWNICARFEDEQGAPAVVETTLDPTGYDPGDHDDPGFSEPFIPEMGPTGPFIGEVLVTASHRQPFDDAGCNCVACAAFVDGPWMVGEGDDGDFTDATIVPFHGMTYTLDFNAGSQAGGFDQDGMSAEAQARFWTVPGSPDATDGIIRRVATTRGDGFYDYQAASIYQGDLNQTMNVAYFYAVNDQGSPRDLTLAVGNDDALRVDVNGEVVFINQICRAHPGFTDKVSVRLYPGKNLFAVFTWENGGGYNACMRFEDPIDNPVTVATTTNPSGYEPGMHPPQPKKFIEEVLMTAALDTLGARFAAGRDPYNNLNIPDDALGGPWLVGTQSDAGAVTDATVIPREGSTLAVDFDASQALRLTAGISGAAQARFWSEASPATAASVFARVTLVDGLADLQGAGIFGADINHTVSAAFFYVQNDGATRCVQVGWEANNSSLVRVNGRVVGTEGNRLHFSPGDFYRNKARAQLDPGKNLIAVYAFEFDGGYQLGIRLEDPDTGSPLGVINGSIQDAGFEGLEVTLDPSGYDPGAHPAPGASCQPNPPRDFGPYIRQEGNPSRGFVTQYLVPQDVFDQPHGNNLDGVGIFEVPPDEYVSIDGEIASVDTVAEGAFVEPGVTGLITTGIRGGNECGLTSLVKFDQFRFVQAELGDPGLFDGELFYGGAPDNYSSSLFFFVDNKTAGSLTCWPGFGSDDYADLYLNGELVAEFTGARGYGARNEIQTRPTEPIELEPGLNLFQFSYGEGGGGSGGRVGLFKDSCMTEVFSGDEIEVSANPPNVVTISRELEPLDCDGNGTVTLRVSIGGGGSANISLQETMPQGASGSNPSRGSFDAGGTVLSIGGQVSDGETITYEIDGTPGTSFSVCTSNFNNRGILGDSVLRGNTDVCDFDREYYVNCGGAEITDTEGRVWTEDTLANPSKHLTGPNAFTALFGAFTPVEMTSDPFVAAEAFPEQMFKVERWNDGPIEYTFSGLPSGTYDVALLFMEGCCSDGCLSGTPDPIAAACDAVDGLIDPASRGVSPGGCRVFDIFINGELVADQFSQNALASCLADTAPGATSNFIGVSQVFTIGVTGGTIQVRIADLGAGNPPENSSIKGICLRHTSDSLPGGGFVRGDVDASGIINITDAVFLLNFLFAGGPTPSCIDAADVDNAGANLPNITDAVFLLNWLFQGGMEPPPPMPGTAAYSRDACGPDPEGDADGIACAAFPPCM